MESKMEIPFMKIGTDMPVVLLTLKNNVQFLAVVDTGSESSLIEVKFVIDNKSVFERRKTNKKVSLLGLNGESNHPLTYAACDIARNEDEMELVFEAVNFNFAANGFEDKYNMRISAIIGSDMLSRYNALIDYEKSTVTFNNIND